MLTNGGNTEGLFRAGWMESGSALPTGDLSKLQGTFDFIASEVGCATAKDALECLREVPMERIVVAQNKTPTFYQVCDHGTYSSESRDLVNCLVDAKHTVDAPCGWRVST